MLVVVAGLEPQPVVNSNLFCCVSEPFERNNVARAVYEKVKFDAIKARFAEVHTSCPVVFLYKRQSDHQ